MASYFLLVKTFSRGKGSSATKAAAYRSGERIRDERSGAVHDYTDRTDVAHAEIVLPAEYAGHTDMEWALNRSVLWNAVQQSGRTWNSRLAREVLVHVPPEMTRAQRVALVQRLSHELADRYHSAVDFAVHEPRPQADQRHHHAHILMTSRQVGPGGIGARTTLELSGTERHDRGLGPSKDDLLWLRERWAQISNEALREAGLTARIDHRSYKEQGINRELKPLLPQSIVYSERGSGRSNPAGDEIRARYRERVEARSKGPADLARVIQRQREEGRQRAIQRAGQRQQKNEIPNGAMTREQLNAKRWEYCKAHAAEISRKQRERRRMNKEEVNRKCGNSLLLRCSASEQGGTAQFASSLIGQREVVHLSQSASWQAGQGGVSKTMNEQRSIEPAVMASEIERLPDLQGFLKFASIPDWLYVSLTYVKYPTVDRPKRAATDKGARKSRSAEAQSKDAPPEGGEGAG